METVESPLKSEDCTKIGRVLPGQRGGDTLIIDKKKRRETEVGCKTRRGAGKRRGEDDYGAGRREACQDYCKTETQRPT